MLSQEQILKFIREKVDHPATARELLQLLKIPREERATFRRHLKGLAASGVLIQTRGKRYGMPERMDLVAGRVQMHPNGFGFVVPDPGQELTSDIYVAGTNLNQAMHGDRVLARIEHWKADGRSEGRIIRIVERSTSTLVGRYEVDPESGLGYVVPFDRRLIMDVHVPKGDTADARPGEMVSLEITRFPTASRHAMGKVIEVLGDVNTPGVDTKIIIRKYGIPEAHSDEAVEEARRLGAAVREKDLRGRTDFVGSSRVDLQACKLEYSIVSPK